MDTNTIELKTSRGHVIVFKSFINGYDKRSIGNAFINAQNTDVADGLGGTRKATPADQLNAANDQGLRATVISVDGSTEDVVNAVLSLDHRDVSEILKKVNEITADEKKD